MSYVTRQSIKNTVTGSPNTPPPASSDKNVGFPCNQESLTNHHMNESPNLTPRNNTTTDSEGENENNISDETLTDNLVNSFISVQHRTLKLLHGNTSARATAHTLTNVEEFHKRIMNYWTKHLIILILQHART